MNTITFDGGVKRQFALPAAIVLSAHAALFLGFVSNPSAPRLTKHISRETPAQQIVLPPPELSVQKGDDQSHNSSAQEQRREIPDPISSEPPCGHEITIVSKIPITSPPIGQEFLGNLGPVIGPDGPPVSRDMLDYTPEVVRQPQPIYPSDARQTGKNGEVVVAFVVDESGRVLNPHVVSSTDPIFEEPTLQAIGRWRFAPGTLHGVPVRFRMSVPVAFHLES